MNGNLGPQFSAYDERPGFPQGSQGGYQQGSLFRNEAPARGAGRYPRGYTPERYREVNQNMPAVGNIGGLANNGFVLNGEAPNAKREADFVAQSYARSSVPAEHLNGLRVVYTAHPIPGGGAGHYRADRDITKGSIEMADSATSPLTAMTRRGLRQARRLHSNQFDRTLVHETGHHREDKFRATTLAGMEATAENYADRFTSPGNPTKAVYDTDRAQQNLERRGGTTAHYQELRKAGTMPWEPLPGQKPSRKRKKSA